VDRHDEDVQKSAEFARKAAAVPKPDWEPSDSEILWRLVQSDPEFWTPGCDLDENTECYGDLPAFLYRLFDGHYWEKLLGTQYGWDGIFSWTLDRFARLPWQDHKLMRAAQENPSLSYRHWIESLGLKYVFGEDIDHRTTLAEVFGEEGG